MNVPGSLRRKRSNEGNERDERETGRSRGPPRNLYRGLPRNRLRAANRCDSDEEMAGRNRRCRSRSGWRLSPGGIRRNASRRSLRRDCALTIPLISNEPVNIGEKRLFEHELAEFFHERPQSRLPHGWNELIMHAALTEQGMCSPLGGAGFEMFVKSESLASGAEQRQKSRRQSIEQPQTIAPFGRVDADLSHAHAKVRILGIAEAAFYAPTFGIFF